MLKFHLSQPPGVSQLPEAGGGCGSVRGTAACYESAQRRPSHSISVLRAKLTVALHVVHGEVLRCERDGEPAMVDATAATTARLQGEVLSGCNDLGRILCGKKGAFPWHFLCAAPPGIAHEVLREVSRVRDG